MRSNKKEKKGGREREIQRLRGAKENEGILGEDMEEEIEDGRQEGKKRKMRWELNKERGQQMKEKRMEMKK